jgi:hypothetical protein
MDWINKGPQGDENGREVSEFGILPVRILE